MLTSLIHSPTDGKTNCRVYYVMNDFLHLLNLCVNVALTNSKAKMSSCFYCYLLSILSKNCRVENKSEIPLSFSKQTKLHSNKKNHDTHKYFHLLKALFCFLLSLTKLAVHHWLFSVMLLYRFVFKQLEHKQNRCSLKLTEQKLFFFL